MNRFEDKVALITGGAMGLGAAISQRLASEGGRILIADIDADRGRETAAGLPGSGHSVLRVDLSKPDEIQELLRELEQLTEDIHVLVNNAGIADEVPLEEVSLEYWDRQQMINLVAPMLLSQALLPLMRDRRAAIVNVSSEVAFNPRVGGVAYDAAKAGLGGLTRSLAAELWKYGIRVNEIAPGGIVTEMHFAHAEDPAGKKRELEEWELPEDINIMRRLGLPAEIAPGVAFLASDDACYVTGSTLHVDGGQGLG